MRGEAEGRVGRREAVRWIGWVVAGLLLVPGCAPGVEAQEAARNDGGGWSVWVGGGGTLYGIETRFDEGAMVGGGVGYRIAPAFMVEGGLRLHSCFDCDRFLVLDAGLQAHRAGERWSPFVGAGAGVVSDPGFMGTKAGLHVSVGSWLRLGGSWDARIEARARQVGISSSDAMGEALVGVARRFGR